MKFTDEQQLAIDLEGKNILVSAGAGSGKTAVLTERVIRKVNSGTSVDNLLILTFTKAAAAEMKSRIRQKLKGSSEYEKISSSYITTFDSFCNSVVKKYHYLLGIPKDFKITDDSVINLKIDSLLEEIFEKHYELKTLTFLNLIKSYSIKHDNEIKKFIKNTYNDINLIYDTEKYLNEFEETYFNPEFLSNLKEKYLKTLLTIIKNISFYQKELLNYDTDYTNSIDLDNLLNSKTYNEIKRNLNINIPNVPNGSSEEFKEAKKKLTEEFKYLISLCSYNSLEDLIVEYLETKPNVLAIIEILRELHERVLELKKEEVLYNFLDVEKLAIKILEEFSEAKEFYKSKFNEILIDEYQDTSDIQEKFINLISNDNVYMVGDIKQSIYRFRNANPTIFKEKYDLYQNNEKGFKIDLNKNFRSNESVINNINKIFNFIMSDFLGNADYRKEHNLVFGNNVYNELNLNSLNSGIEILNINEITNEKEAFLIAQDIKDKISSGMQIFDKDNKVKRDIDYKDITILIDRSKDFVLYKKIFEYFNIPLIVKKEESIKEDVSILIIKNSLILIKKVLEEKFDKEFEYAFLSVGRSYLFEYNDDLLYEMIVEKKYIESELFNLIKDFKNLSNTSISNILTNIISKFKMYEKVIKVGNIYKNQSLINNLLNLANELDSNYDLDEFVNYLQSIIDGDIELRHNFNKGESNGVKLMTIHGSKGLEFPIVYYPGLKPKFNLKDVQSRFIYHKNYGLILPTSNPFLKNTFLKELAKNEYMVDEISEKIRLFYVALSRAREKIIVLTEFKEDINYKSLLVPDVYRLNYRSFQDMLESVQNNFKDFITYHDIDVDSNYKFIKENNFQTNLKPFFEKIVVEENNEKYITYEKQIFSNDEIKYLDNASKKFIKEGNVLHSMLENIDFFNVVLTNNPYIDAFLENEILKDVINYYSEYEFIYELDNVEKVGSIDLLLEKEKEFIIVDYKLKNIDKEEYFKQLKGYKEYIETLTDKKVKTYLYSIIKKELREITL